MVKEFIPPILLRYLTGFFYGWKGNYNTWEEAQKKCTGYDSDIIFSKVRESLLKVKKGEAVFERDSIIFDKIQYSFPLLSALSIVALNKGKLNIADFGGSLGSSYYQNRAFFKNLSEFNWNVIEQSHFVYTIEECTEKYKIDILLLASVLQYIENPYALLDTIFSQNIEYIMIDRTPVMTLGEERITIQKVPKNIYEAQYPCRIFNEQKLINYISKRYDLLFESQSPERMNINNAILKAYFFKKRK
jgi:putative methyltransferase (TIGR04325 family)